MAKINKILDYVLFKIKRKKHEVDVTLRRIISLSSIYLIISSENIWIRFIGLIFLMIAFLE